MVVSEAPTGAVPGLDADRILEVLNEIPHPDAGIGIVDLGLIYGVEVDGRNVRVRMTMMQPDNPSRGLLIDEVETMIRARFRSVRAVSVELVWNPPWRPNMMSAAAAVQPDRAWRAAMLTQDPADRKSAPSPGL